jgi:AcrR family transcriptional regulator
MASAKHETATGSRQPHSGGATRRRGTALEDALLDAAWDELHQVGYAAMTMEAVADRAGTSRAVLYRRWPKRADLVIAALGHRRPVMSGAVPDTGSLRGDVIRLLEQMSDRLGKTGIETIFGLLGDYLGDPDLFARHHEQFRFTGPGVMATIAERAVKRGEAPADLPPRVLSIPTDLFRNELFLRRSPPSRRVIADIVDNAFMPLVNAQT